MKSKTKQNIFAAAILVGAIVTLYYLSSVIGDLNSWNDWNKPVEVSKLIRCIVFGLIAFAGAIGINPKDFIYQFLPSSSELQVSQEKINSINSSSKEEL